MRRAIFAIVFCLAAAGTAAAADDTLAGLIQAGNRDAALKQIAEAGESLSKEVRTFTYFQFDLVCN